MASGGCPSLGWLGDQGLGGAGGSQASALGVMVRGREIEGQVRFSEGHDKARIMPGDTSVF